MKFEAILFDCDGVLVDSEPITNGVLCTMLNEAGWAISAQDCMEIFIGKTVRSEAARIQAHTGKPLTDAWMAAFYKRRNVRLEAELQAIDGALDAVAAVHARLGGRIACASGADRYKVEMQLQKVGLAPYFAGRVFSGHEMPATKPAPDVYLAAAAALPGGGRHGDRRDRRRGCRRHRGGLVPLARGPRFARGPARCRGSAGLGAPARTACTAGLIQAPCATGRSPMRQKDSQSSLFDGAAAARAAGLGACRAALAGAVGFVAVLARGAAATRAGAGAGAAGRRAAGRGAGAL